jgi:hypothetical protein
MVVGPLAGGVLVQAASWRWIFAINLIPVAITLGLLRRLPADSRRPGHVDVVGAILCVFCLGGPVFALIEQPSHGWGDPLVALPLAVGLLLMAAFVAWERHTPEPMLPLRLFTIRNFTMGNLSTLTLYAGLGVATFFLVLFLQEVGGYTPVKAGLSLLPVTLIMFLLARRFGALAGRIGPRLFMTAGPIVAGLGLLELTRADGSASYLDTILPGIVIFGLGMSATVAPLTATVLGSAGEGRSGLASGVNNAVARVAGLLAIAVLGAVVSASFQARLDRELGNRALSAPARAAVAQARTRPLVIDASAVPTRERPLVHRALVDSSVHAFRVGMGIAGGLAMLGGVLALIGIRNPRPRRASARVPAEVGA